MDGWCSGTVEKGIHLAHEQQVSGQERTLGHRNTIRRVVGYADFLSTGWLLLDVRQKPISKLHASVQVMVVYYIMTVLTS